MIYLTVKSDNVVLGTYHFEDIKVITIGRAPSNDIVLNDGSVSGQHAKIEAVDNGYLLTDLQSKNGVFVNKKFISSHWLKNGDIITIGANLIDFACKGDEADDGIDQTMVLDIDSYKEMRAENFLRVAMGEGLDDIQGELIFLGDQKGTMELVKKVTTIGKDPNSDIVVSGLLVAKTAATISKQVDGHHLSYVGGFTKPKVSDIVVKDSILLKDSVLIKIGNVTMKYVDKKK
ncbi:MAG: FHA domain-containing protein [Desulfobulbaceae bacterium]|nr:FHA domain-containing protein [Desulfobulbaceae bacterium]